MRRLWVGMKVTRMSTKYLVLVGFCVDFVPGSEHEVAMVIMYIAKRCAQLGERVKRHHSRAVARTFCYFLYLIESCLIFSICKWMVEPCFHVWSISRNWRVMFISVDMTMMYSIFIILRFYIQVWFEL